MQKGRGLTTRGRLLPFRREVTLWYPRKDSSPSSHKHRFTARSKNCLQSQDGNNRRPKNNRTYCFSDRKKNLGELRVVIDWGRKWRRFSTKRGLGRPHREGRFLRRLKNLYRIPEIMVSASRSFPDVACIISFKGQGRHLAQSIPRREKSNHKNQRRN